jgi:hypothetical protein
MYIANESGNIYISVEEYKRPNFEVAINPIKGSYKLDEQINVTGTAKAELEKIQDREWLDAQKRLQVDGFVRSSSDSLNRERDFVMINRDLYSSGMHLTLTNQAIVFTWTVEIPNYRQVNFKRVSAVRVGPGGVPAQK